MEFVASKFKKIATTQNNDRTLLLNVYIDYR